MENLFNRVLIVFFVLSFVMVIAPLQSIAQTQPIFVLNGAYLNLSGGTSASPVFFVVNGENTAGITRQTGGGHIYTEGQYDFVKWNAGTGTGNYVFPFGVGGADSNYIPFTFNKTSSGSSDITASTWTTNQQNMPHPGASNVPACYIMKGPGDSVSTAIDRFWDIRTSASVTANVTFSYRGSENTTSAPADQLKAQRWNGGTLGADLWSAPAGAGNTGVSSGIGTVGPVTGQTNFTPFVLTRSSAPLVVQNIFPIANAGTDQTICKGSVIIGGSPSASMGTPPYTYSWSPSATLSISTIANPVATLTTNTTYTLAVTDAQGFIKSSVVTITVLSSPTANAGTAQTICKGTTVNLGGSPTASGGTAPYLYLWTPADSLNYDTLSNPTAKPSITTPYTVTVIDNNNCQVTAQVTITVKKEIYAFAGNDTIIANRDTITLGGNPTASFGVPPFTYSWSPSGSLNNSTNANPRAYPTSNTNYTVTVSDASGCTNSKDVVAVKVDTLPYVSAGPDIRACLYDSVTLGGNPTAIGGVLPLTYSWSPSGSLNNSAIANPKASPASTATYVITVTDNLGFIQRDTMVLTVNPLPSANAGNDTTIYYGNISLGGNPTASGGVPPYRYNWYAQNAIAFNDFSNPNVTLLDTTEYFVIVTDSNNCQAKDSVKVNFNNIFGSSCNCDSCTWAIDDTVSTNFTINSGQKLCIRPTGLATGTITINSGGEVCNSGKLEPAVFTFNGGKLVNNSTGTVTIPNTNITLGSSDTLINDGVFTTGGNIIANSGSKFYNYGTVETQGKITVNTSGFYNYNAITLNTKNLIINSSAAVNNYGSLRGVDSLKNSGTLKMGDSALIFTGNYFNYASAVTTKINPDTTTYGGIMVCSRTENYGTISDSIDICDKSPSAGPVYLDVNSGTVASSVTFCKTLFIVKDSSEGCGTCPTLAILNNGCAGDNIVFTASSSKAFDNYDFYKDDTLVQSGADSIYILESPGTVGDTYSVIGTSYFTPCKTILSNTVTILSKPTVTISGNAIADADSVTLTASGASTYVWFTLNGDSAGTGSTIKLFPPVTTSYVVKGTNSNGCYGTDTFELQKKLKVSYTVQPASYYLPYSGGINLTPIGGKYPFAFLWNTGSTEQNLSGLTVGTYSVLVTDANGQTATAKADVGSGADWGSAVGVSVSGNSVTRTASGNGWGQAGSFASNIINSGSNGWAEFAVSNTTDSYMFGLSTTNTNGEYTGINYAVSMEAGGALKVYESGTLIGSFGAYAIGDVIRVERQGSTILYRKNGTQFNSSSTNASLSLRVSTALNTSAAVISGIQGLFLDYSFENPFGVNSKIGGHQPVCSADANKNFIHTINYDENENIISEGKVYSDFLGRPIQAQTKIISDNSVIATQTIYDAQGRSVLQTLPAPINQTDLCFYDKFITNTSGGNYSAGDFDVPDYTGNPNFVTAGEVDKPNPVASTNGLGFYYSNNNIAEPYAPASSFPYTRVEYDDNNRGDIRRTVAAGERLNMGSGHETQTYKMTTLNELDYLYGKDKSWFVVDYSDAGNDGQGAISPAAIPTDYRVTKTISVDANGQEVVVFTNLDGKTLASCLSGQVNGVNVNTKQVGRTVLNSWFVDVHLPQGCESSLVLGPWPLMTFNILDLKTGRFVKFGNSNDYEGTQPNLKPGFYRVIYKGGDPTQGRDSWVPSISVTQDINYYNFTVNYYDRAGRLRLTVPPAGVDNSYNPTSNPNGLPDHKMIASNEYNSLGQLVSGITPDAGKTEYLYRTDGQIRFSQNARQRASSANAPDRKFSYVNYDNIGRAIETGEYDPLAAAASPSSFSQSEVESPLELTGRSQASTTLYDVEDANPASYTQQFLPGKVSMTSNVSSSTWYSYDELGRMSWTVQNLNDMPVSDQNNYNWKTTNYKYDLTGNVTEVAYQKEESAEDFYHYYEYDADKRLKKVLTSTDAGLTKQEQAEYFYYKHGPLKRVELAGKLQGIDYVYTINGWLKSMNTPELNQRDPGKDGYAQSLNHVPKDLFGMTLDYFAGDYLRRSTYVQTYDGPAEVLGDDDPVNPKNLYNGLIKDQRWQTRIPDPVVGNASVAYQNNQLFYGYTYDNKYQLTNAFFGPVTFAGTLNANIPSPINKYRGPVFTYTQDYKISNLTYDLNGNIKTLQRNAYTHSGGLLAMDDLSYNYNTVSSRLINNKLTRVDDAVSGTPYASLEFADGQAANNYVYDATGQQTEDNSANPAYTDYDVYGKVTAVYADAAKTTLRARFTYDEKGFRIRKENGQLGGADTWYMRDASGNVLSVYEKRGGIFGEVMHQKELSIFGDKRLGMLELDGGKYLYELSDHLGNVRTTFSQQTVADISTAFEGTGDDYLFTFNSNMDKTIGHTAAPSVKTDNAHPFGTGIFNMPVKTGQVVTGSFYYKTDGIYNPDAMLVLNLASTNNPAQVIDWNSSHVTGSTNWAQLNFSYSVIADGLLSIYPWNNDPTQTVWFDDLSFSFSNGGGIVKTDQQSLTDYYPHGSAMPGRNYVGSNAYRYGYQGQFAEKDNETNKNSFELRDFDPLLGRWMTIDPEGQYHSPYMAMDNNPVSSVDKDGGFAAWGSWGVAVLFGGIALAAELNDHNPHDDVKDAFIVAGAFVAGGVLGGWAQNDFKLNKAMVFNWKLTNPRYNYNSKTFLGYNWDWMEGLSPKIDFVKWRSIRWDSWTMLGGIGAQGTYKTSFSIPTLQGGNIRVAMDPGWLGNAATWNVNYNGKTKSATVSDVTDGWHFPMDGSGKSSVVTINVSPSQNRQAVRTVVFEYVRSSIILKRPRIRLR